MQITEKGKYLTREKEIVIVSAIRKNGVVVGRFEKDIKAAEDAEMQKYGHLDQHWSAVARRGTDHTWLQDGRKNELSRHDNEQDIVEKL